MTFDLEELRAKFKLQLTEDLLRIVNVDLAEYQPDAIECVRDELRSRGLWYIDSEGEEKYGIAEESLKKKNVQCLVRTKNAPTAVVTYDVGRFLSAMRYRFTSTTITNKRLLRLRYADAAGW